MWPNMDATKPDGYSTEAGGIPSVTMLVSQQFANSLYESCDSVKYLLFLKAVNLMCGTSDCSPSAFLNYMGNIDNGRAPFPIVYNIGSSWTSPDNTTLMPLNTFSARCNHEITQSSDFIGK